MITLEVSADTPVVVEGPGWRQVTKPRGGRHYEIVGHDCEQFSSISGLPWCDDFSGAARYMAGAWVARNLADLAASDLDSVRATVAHGAEAELDAAADRGTAVHHYIEALDTDGAIDWDWIDRSGARPWLAAVDAYRVQRADVTERHTEVVCFDPADKIAGTVDAVETTGADVVVVDYKTRTTRHDRRTKEAAQLGGYIACLASGGMIDGKGRRHVVEATKAAIVTFAPDGTYAAHVVDVDRAVELHRMRLPLRDVSVANTFEKATGGSSDMAAVLRSRLDALDSDATEALKALWVRHSMPRIADVDVDSYGRAVQLFEAVEPFRTPTTTTTYADIADIGVMLTRWRFMPADLIAAVEREAFTAGGGSLMASAVDVDQLATWDHWIGLGEWARDTRYQLITDVLELDDEPIIAALGPWAEWTERDVDLACEIKDAGTEANLEWIEKKADGKRNAVAVAKAACAEWDLPKPTKFADIAADIRVYAVTVTALQTSNQGAQ